MVAAALALSGIPAAAAAPIDAGAVGPWVSIAGVYGTGRIADFTAASEPAPGVSILQPAPDGTASLCTAGWPVMSVRRDIGW